MFRPRTLTSLVLFALLALLSVYFYRDTMLRFPSHIHAWTQSDRLALSHGFLHNGFNLFKPQTFNLATRDGVTGVDLPVHEWIVALLMKVFGPAPGVFRMYVLALCMLGYWFYARLVREVTGNPWMGVAAAVILFTCPVLTYYQAGFLPSATAFAAVLAGYFYFFRYLENGRRRDWHAALALLTLAALVRLPTIMFLVTALLQWLFSARRAAWRRLLPSIAGAWIVLALYNAYKSYLGASYGSQFLTVLMPAESIGDLWRLSILVAQRWHGQVFTSLHYWILLAILPAPAVYYALKHSLPERVRPVLLQAGLSLAAAAAYYVAMARQFVDHEYYFIDSLYPSVALAMAAGLACWPNEDKLLRRVAVALTVLLSGAAFQSKLVQERKYADTLWDRAEVTRRNFTGADALLDSLGISREARILVIDAYSTNAPLLLQQRRGYTVLNTTREEISHALELPYEYIAIQDIFFPSDVVGGYPEITGLLERIGGNGRISVYRRRAVPQENSVEMLLGLDQPRDVVKLDFEWPADSSAWQKHHVRPDTAAQQGRLAGRLDGAEEFGPGTEFGNVQSGLHRAWLSGWFNASDGPANLRVVASIFDGDKKLWYWEFPLQLNPEQGWQRRQFLFPFTVKNGPVTLRCYVWNPERGTMLADALELRVY